MRRVSKGAQRRAERRIREQRSLDPSYGPLPGGQTPEAVAYRRYIAETRQAEVFAAYAADGGPDHVVLVVDPEDKKGTAIMEAEVGPEACNDLIKRKMVGFFAIPRGDAVDYLKNLNPLVAAQLEDSLPGIPFVVMARGGSLLASVETN